MQVEHSRSHLIRSNSWRQTKWQHDDVQPRISERTSQKLVTGKYRCRKVRVYPTKCGEQLGRDPSKSLVLKSFFWGENTLGLVPSSHPHSLGYACTLCTPTAPLPKKPLRGFFCDSVFTTSVPHGGIRRLSEVLLETLSEEDFLLGVLLPLIVFPLSLSPKLG